MQTYPLPRILRQALRANRDHRLVYLNNPKVGCSTIKANLWSGITGCSLREITDVHADTGSPFERDIATLDWAGDAFVFSFVRNPYVRIVSAYLDKVAGRTDTTWENFARRHGHDPDAGISFDAFVEALSAIPSEDYDPHWRPQHLNILYPFVTPDFLGDLETMDQHLPALLERLFPTREVAFGRRQKHRTGAQDRFAGHLRDRATVRRLQQIYAGDFEAFGYDPDPSAAPAPRQAVMSPETDHSGLARLAQYTTARRGQRRAALRALAEGAGGAALTDWIIGERLRLATEPERVARLLQRHAGRIRRGPAFLRDLALQAEARMSTMAEAPVPRG